MTYEIHNPYEPNVASESEVIGMNQAKAQEALLIAQEIARHAKSAVDFHNAFFGVGAKFSELFPTRAEKEAFAQTPLYREILGLRAHLAQSENAAS